jgi:outer membrane receptor protein involved in Fe transport
MNIRNFAHGAIAMAIGLAAALSSPALAQQEVRPFVTSYATSFFASSHPNSAYEMVNLLPSFQLTEGDSKVRGYAGTIGNVLIDGHPPATKDETLQTILGRVNLDSVERIEVIRTGAQGYDFQGYPMLVNVILKPTIAPKGQVSLEEYVQRHGHFVNPNLIGRMSWGTTDVLELAATGTVSTPPAGYGYGTRSNYTTDHGTTLRRDVYILNRHDDVWNLTGSYRQPLLGGQVRITGLYNESRMFAPLIDNEFYPVITASPGGESEFKTNSEFGLQYNHKFWAGDGELNLIRRANQDFHPQSSTIAGVLQVSSTQQYTSESILHSVIRQNLWDGVHFDGGVDATLNTLGNTVALTKGGVPIALPAASVHLEEKRAEATANLTWQLSPDLTIESGLRYEISRLKQTGDSNVTRVLNFWKPRIKGSYKLDNENMLRMTITREAGQLNFNNYVTTVETKVNQVNSGNKNLKPQTLYQLELTWEHAIKGGSLVLTGRHQWISDTVDNVAINGVAGLFNATGNIGGGRLDQVAANLVMPVDFMPGLTVQANVQYNMSSVVDPETHIKRMISGNLIWQGKLTLTQDLPEWRARVGASYTAPVGQNAYRFNEIQERHSKFPETEIFAEYKPSQDWLLRAYVDNILDARNIQKRYIWNGARGSSTYGYLEDRRLTYGPTLGFSARYLFGQ